MQNNVPTKPVDRNIPGQGPFHAKVVGASIGIATLPFLITQLKQFTQFLFALATSFPARWAGSKSGKFWETEWQKDNLGPIHLQMQPEMATRKHRWFVNMYSCANCKGLLPRQNWREEFRQSLGDTVKKTTNLPLLPDLPVGMSIFCCRRWTVRYVALQSNLQILPIS